MKVHINWDEWYPIYEVFEAEDGRYEISSEQYARWTAAKEAHAAALDEIDDIIDHSLRAEQETS